MPRGEAALKLGRVRAGLTPVVPPSLLFVLVGDLNAIQILLLSGLTSLFSLAVSLAKAILSADRKQLEL